MGTAILTDLPCRINPVEFSPDVVSSTRISSGIVRLGSFDVLVVSIYGVTGMTPNSRKANDYLLATIFEVAAVARLPVVIGGDFNIRPTSLPSFELFRQQGFVEAFDLYEIKHGFQLPPTCNGKTRNDTFILHPKLIPFVKDMRVVTGCIFDKHSPFIIDSHPLRKKSGPPRLPFPVASWQNWQKAKKNISTATTAKSNPT